jgi:quinol monooxygenase YgiN
MAGFIQIIQYSTSRIDEVQALAQERMAQQPESESRIRGLVAADRDHPNQYFVIVEFDSYEAAMENSNRPDTTEFSEKMGALCDGPPTFHNLDVMDRWEQ